MQHIQYPRGKTINHYRSADGQSQDGAGSVLLLFLSLKVASTSFMNVCNQLQLEFPKMESQELLRLR